MSQSLNRKEANKRNRSQINRIVVVLAMLALLTAAFTFSVVRIQSGVSVYLGGLSVWSRAQVEAVRYSELYLQTGDIAHLKLAQKWLEIPIGDMNGRLALESDPISLERSREGFLQGLNHPDDISTMILMFRTMKNAPYMKEAIVAWRSSDDSLIALMELLPKIEKEWSKSPVDMGVLQSLGTQLVRLDEQLTRDAEAFRDRMSTASRTLVLILSVLTVVIFIVLFFISTYLILRLTKSLRHSELKFRKTFENAGMGIAQLDMDGQILEANEAFCKILKFDKKDIYNKSYEQLVKPEDSQQNSPHYKFVKDTRDSVNIESQIICGDGSVARAKINLSMFEQPALNSTQYICIVEDVSEQHRLSVELNRHARQDDLTGLINRRAFKNYLQESLNSAKNDGFVHCLCFVDLDRFKIVNDTSGHIAGDQILRQVAKRLAGKVRKNDILARLGGDEFALILDNCEPERAVKIAESLRLALTEIPFIWQNKQFNIGCSIGLAPITSKTQNLEELLKAADLACHLAKEKGRDRVVLTYEGDQNVQARRVQYEWISRIRTALENKQFYLDVQKIVSTSARDKVRLEVLIRMLGDNGEAILPGDFLPAAERYGLAHLIDRWVISEVCHILSEHKEQWDTFHTCHINISGRSFDQHDFTEFTLKTLESHNIPGEKLCFEITETAAVSNLSDIYDFMEELRKVGCSFALDDFGTGLASFSYLKQIPVECLKIDGTFVKNMAQDEVDCAMVKAICDIGHALNKTLVAEFVQDQRSRVLLDAMGVEFLQGYFLHRPERFESVLDSL
ncbi:MAG: diguanylate cyclase (GGDEF)-like protein/PAS domain S-box-containing protein [Glaciecola sp.]|jgi:diguanylate cyclase (GGDEF)-like protein/PAS domain S-box-containing protein